MLKTAGAKTLDLFAIATQEPCKAKAGARDDRYGTRLSRPMNHDPRRKSDQP
jgi:hypothetical protein